MLNIGQLVATVQKNCHISDAQFAGDYSLCIFLLKMREFYRWENQISFMGSLPRAEVGKWMQEREQLWDDMAAHAFEFLNLGDDSLDPFDTEAITALGFLLDRPVALRIAAGGEIDRHIERLYDHKSPREVRL